MRPYAARQYLDWDGGFVMHDIVEPLKPPTDAPRY